MSDTIELLEAIGRAASLRYASAGELTSMLERAQASAALTAAAVSGDSAELSQELGCGPLDPPQTGQTVFDEEEGLD